MQPWAIINGLQACLEEGGLSDRRYASYVTIRTYFRHFSCCFDHGNHGKSRRGSQNVPDQIRSKETSRFQTQNDRSPLVVGDANLEKGKGKWRKVLDYTIIIFLLYHDTINLS